MTIEIHEPELEELIRKKMLTGQFTSVEEVLLKALQGASSDKPSEKAPKKSLAQMLIESPLHGSGIVLERLQDGPRPIDFE